MCRYAQLFRNSVTLVWQIEFDPAAQKELKKPDPQAAKRILEFLKKWLTTQLAQES